MGNLLYLVHRLPFPPDKGDKVRSYHLLEHLRKNHNVYLGTFVDDAADEPHVPTVRGLCADAHVARLKPFAAKLRSSRALLGARAMSLDYYRDTGLSEWVRQTLARQRIDAVIVFSSAMAQYAEEVTSLPVLVDFVDVDSAKWTQYSERRTWPMSWLYRREGRLLLDYERRVAAKSRRSFFVTDNESALFKGLAPECAGVVDSMSNGVDSDFFAPSVSRPSPFKPDEVPLVFTGAMDYWPNIDAVTWFAKEILPLVQGSQPALRFYVVGRNPPPSVTALASSSTVVTGTVPDVRPYLQHAAVVVAPLRIARGIQNKVLEAMAMARPVVAAESCVQAIDAKPGLELVGAETVEDFAREILRLLASPHDAAAIGLAGRDRVVASYSWEARLAGIDAYIPAKVAVARPEAIAEH